LSGFRVRLAAAGVVASGVLLATVAFAQTTAEGRSAEWSSVAAAIVEEGKTLFQARCGMCHLQGGTGTFMLGRRLGLANALLAERTNLDATYVKHVVRNGIVSMPRITRAEVSDAELQAIVGYLVRKRGAREQSTREEAARERGERGQAAREQGQHEQGAPEQGARKPGSEKR
jgi:cytochrome c5